MPLMHTAPCGGEPPSEQSDHARRFDIFRRLDADGDGQVSSDDMRRGLASFGIPTHHCTIRGVFEDADQNRDGVLNFEEFNAYCDHKEAYLRREFDRLDVRRCGKLSVGDIRRVMLELGVHANGPELKALSTYIERELQGSVDFCDFRRLFGLVPFDKMGFRLWFAVWQRQSSVNAMEHAVLPNDEALAPWQSFAAGAVAGIASRTATAPLERLKVLAQLKGSEIGVDVLPVRWGIVSGVRAMAQEGGVRALFRGNGTNCLKVAPQGGLQWLAFEALKERLSPGDGEALPVHLRFVCGAGAGMVSQTFIYPLEIVKTRLSVAPAHYYRGIGHCLTTIGRTEGLRALFRGLGTSLLGRIPYSGVDLTIYETLKMSYKRHFGKDQRPPVWVLLLCGTFSCACGQTCAYPFAFCRSYLQAQGMLPAGRPQYRGLWDCVRGTVRRKGVLGLYAGLYANLVQCLPSSGIGYVVYETCKEKMLAC